MSELMDRAVIGMPFDMAMQNHLSRMQFYNRAKAILAERDALLAERDALQGQLDDLRNGWAKSVKAHAALLAERDAAFAAGLEAVVDWLDGFDTTGWDDREAIWAIGWVAELVRKSLPIKPHP